MTLTSTPRSTKRIRLPITSPKIAQEPSKLKEQSRQSMPLPSRPPLPNTTSATTTVVMKSELPMAEPTWVHPYSLAPSI